ncbi:MAG: PSD1 and planctomycete cytochrome C domain-containing protein [Planctomycetaceae bacterium]
MHYSSRHSGLNRHLRVFVITVLVFSSASWHLTAADEGQDLFEQRIRPLLLEKCIECHGPGKQENGVRLDRRDDVLHGKAGDSLLINLAAPDESRLLKVLHYVDGDTQMPPSGKLDDLQLHFVEEWIARGAVWPETSDLEGEAKRRAEKWREHWAFVPPVMPDLSQISENENPVDYFIRTRLAEKNLTRSAPAAPRVLVRRLSFALVGLPPESAELAAAEDAHSNGTLETWTAAYIDRLLASPQFGERWGRYWLDIARYADTKGYVFQEDREYPDAWRFREWVIKAINDDMPYDEFLKRQLSADRMPGSDDPAQLAAMGYLTLGRRFLNNKHDIIDDRIDVVTRGMLGLTVTCARCHDHKFDPIPTADYYSLYGIFASSDEPKNEPSTLRLVDLDKPVDPVIFQRGNPGNRGEAVARRFLTALSTSDMPAYSDGSGRLELAASIASRLNPLTGRVAVNRVWMHLFDRGLVDSPSDFGVRTDPPTHPELLDYLTVSFMEHGWSLKSLIRRIVLSETWQQSSDRRLDAEAIDPENRLLARMNRTRLDFEAQRDAVLSVAGRLDRTVGGKSVDVTQDFESPRRTIYARIDRQNFPGLFRTFDMASPDAHAARRFQTTVPQQALFQLNSPFIMNRATEIAQATESLDSVSDPTARIRKIFEIVLRREPVADEVAQFEACLTQLQHDASPPMHPSGWSYGYGTMDEMLQRVREFAEFPMAKGGTFQGGDKLPDPTLGWVSLNRGGGHPGGSLSRCAIRRWTAPDDCLVDINCVTRHLQKEGDGVRCRIVSPTRGVLADNIAQNSTATANVEAFDMRGGTFIDFVVDCRAGESHDSFASAITITQSAGGNIQRTWNSETDFRDKPAEAPLSPWAQLVQALLLTNEFIFVD